MRFAYHIDKNHSTILSLTPFITVPRFNQCPRKEIYILFTIKLQLYVQRAALNSAKLSRWRAAIVISSVHLALIVSFVVGILGLRVAAPLLRGVGTHRREPHAAGHRRGVVVPVGALRHGSVARVPAEYNKLTFYFILLQT